ncbi:MAG TPA: hypothetical protein PK825_03975 [Bacteroidales bacterium]|nr:hypothetical protein [Bacteroidales bacterium]
MEKPSQSFTLIDDLIRLSRKHKTSEEFRNFIEFIGRFPDYAFYNRMLVYLQNPAVTLFGSHTFWDNCFKRKVKDNARPYIVLMPFGPVGLVFDIMDTEGDIDPKELLDQVTKGGPFSAEGNFTSEQLNAVIKEISKWGIETSFEEVNYFKAGMVTISENGKIIISLRKDLKPVENFVTLLHELGHLFAGHLGGMRLINKKQQEKIVKSLDGDCQVWLSGVQLALEEFSGIDLLPSRILLCGGGSMLPDIKKLLEDSDWVEDLPFAKKPKVSFIHPRDVANVIDETQSLDDAQDITPMALANMAIDLAGTPSVITGAMDKIVDSLKE